MIHLDQRGRIALVTIDRPERRNAVDHEALEQLTVILDSAVADVPGTRVVVLTGSGGHFCAGADLTGVEDAGFASVLRGVLDRLRDAPMPTIAAVEGAALGAGSQLAIACDLRVATPSARFGIPAAKLGLMVDHWTVQRLALLAGHGPARAMLLAAEIVDGDSAVRLGLAQRAGDLGDALAWADDIANLAPLTIQGHKLMLNRLEPDVGRDPEVAAAFARAWDSNDLREGITAFHERRPPEFSGE
ncbi:MAG TPA: enoyl-CoA hydratase [Acidimicrobiales bacterium]|nr:enoyl-CoA hydratase [Acidimicrobiales bacterium]